MLNPRQLEAFRAVMLTGGVTAAAELMHVTQPAVSRLIGDLEHATGLKLFERRGARVHPTREASSLYHEVERSFVGLDRIAKAVEDLKGRRAGVLRIAALPALAGGFLPRYVARFLEPRPKLDVEIFGHTSAAVVERVASGHCEIGYAQAPIEHATLEGRRMPSVEAVAVMPENHRLAAKALLEPQDFANEAFISLGKSTLLRYRIDAVFADREVPRRLQVETPLSMIACALVSGGAGLSIVEPFTAAEYANRGLAVRPFSPAIGMEMTLLTPTQHRLSEIAQEFIAGFREAVAAFARDPIPRR